MKGSIFFFRPVREQKFIRYDGTVCDSILNAVGFLREVDADAYMDKQSEPIILCEMPVWEWLAACNDARAAL